MHISSGAQRLIAAWITKTSLIQLLTLPKRYVSSDQYLAFGSVVQPLTKSVILVGSVSDYRGRPIRGHNRLLRLAGDGVVLAPDAVCATHLLGHFVFQVVFHNLSGAQRLAIDPQLQRAGYLGQLWPCTPGGLNWPPPSTFTDEQFEELALKCASRVGLA